MEAEGARRRKWLDAQHAHRGPVYREMHIAVAHSINSARCRRDEAKAVRLGRMQRSENDRDVRNKSQVSDILNEKPIQVSEDNHIFRTNSCFSSKKQLQVSDNHVRP